MSEAGSKASRVKDLVPTEEQEAVINAMSEPESLMATAYAGCSKSTTLEMGAPRIRVPAIALAFNKKIAKDLEPRLPGNFTVKTFNGFGHGAWMRANPLVNKWQLDERKLGRLVTQVVKDRKVTVSGEQWDQLRRLVSAAMLAGITPGNEGSPMTPDTKEAWGSIAEDLWILEDQFEFLFDMAHEVLERDIAEARSGVISFDDQVYCSACLGGVFPKFPVMMVDEAQDLNSLNHRALALAMRPDGKLITVGDPKQAIYGFRGAHSDSMGQIRDLRPSWLDRPLRTTFRCPKVIVQRNRDHAPGFAAWHTNAEGRFLRLKARSQDGIDAESSGWTFADLRATLPHERASLVILCRNNGPLFSMAFKLLRQGVGVMMLGREIGKGLLALSKKLAPEDNTPRDIVAGLVREWMVSETSLALAKGHEEKVAGIEDRGECLLAVLDSAEARDAGQLRAVLERLFAREAGQVHLSSIHRVKGLEYDCVLHLDPWRIPSKWAREAARAGDPRQLEQEFNLLYVAETRTKHTLVNANLEDFEGDA